MKEDFKMKVALVQLDFLSVLMDIAIKVMETALKMEKKNG